jgi:hypothetical protein
MIFRSLISAGDPPKGLTSSRGSSEPFASSKRSLEALITSREFPEIAASSYQLFHQYSHPLINSKLSLIPLTPLYINFPITSPMENVKKSAQKPLPTPRQCVQFNFLIYIA